MISTITIIIVVSRISCVNYLHITIHAHCTAADVLHNAATTAAAVVNYNSQQVASNLFIKIGILYIIHIILYGIKIPATAFTRSCQMTMYIIPQHTDVPFPAICLAVDQYYSFKSLGAVVTIFYIHKHSECHKHNRVHNCNTR